MTQTIKLLAIIIKRGFDSFILRGFLRRVSILKKIMYFVQEKKNNSGPNSFRTINEVFYTVNTKV